MATSVSQHGDWGCNPLSRGGLQLLPMLRLIGEGSSSRLAEHAGLAMPLPTHSADLPDLNSTDPVITNGSGNGITVAGSNRLRGFNIDNNDDRPDANLDVNYIAANCPAEA